jgi:hypothetical protein
MAKAVAARRQGDDFQARLFWLHASSLLDAQSPVIKVAFETGPKSFDDVLIEYDPKRAGGDHEGKPVLRRHIQCKWHTTAGAFGYADLIDPAFINAERYSLLQKTYLAQQQHAPEGVGCRFELVTNWRIKADDPLLDLVRKSHNAIDLEALFEGKTDRSRMGQVRQLWCGHLGIDHAGLALVARVLGVAEWSQSLDELRGRLDERFAHVGMKRVPAAESAFFYDDLAAKLLAQGRIEFDRDGFRKMAEREDLLDPNARPDDDLTVGIRSFMHPIDPLEERCDRMLNLVPYFDGRYIRAEADWQDRVHPELSKILLDAARASERLRLIMDAHASLAFATGAILNVKSGKRIEVEQRFGGRRFWSMDDQPADAGWPAFEFEEEVLDARAADIALAIGITHDVSGAVRAYAKGGAAAIGRILHCRPRGGASQQAVVCGRHAFMLAESTVQEVRRLRERGAGQGRIHLFIAGPNSFTFFLGQHQQALGPVSSYEWDFDGRRGGGYSVGLSVGG